MTKFCVSSLEVLCFVFTAATFSCSFVGLSAFSFVFNNQRTCWFNLDQVTDHWKIWYHWGNFFALINFQVAFAMWVESFVIWCTVSSFEEEVSIAPYTSAFILLLALASVNTSAAVHAHTISKTMFDRWCRRCDLVWTDSYIGLFYSTGALDTTCHIHFLLWF